jgi:hypothetical protein
MEQDRPASSVKQQQQQQQHLDSLAQEHSTRSPSPINSVISRTHRLLIQRRFAASLFRSADRPSPQSACAPSFSYTHAAALKTRQSHRFPFLLHHTT